MFSFGRQFSQFGEECPGPHGQHHALGGIHVTAGTLHLAQIRVISSFGPALWLGSLNPASAFGKAVKVEGGMHANEECSAAALGQGRVATF
jgi:hypothetical protein